MKIKYWRLKAPAYWVTGAKGRISNSIYFPKFWKAKEIKCHSLDFEKILSEESDYPKEIVSNKNYAVFLDEFYPFHPDYYYSNLECPVTPDKYFESICKFFDVVEKEFGLRVVIAAHPRSDYDQRLEDYFAGRQIIKGETLGLVKEANLIVAHSSTSLSYAVFYKKPVVLITTDQIEQKLFFRLGISQMANALGCCKINCNRFSMNKSKVLSINKKKYDFYLKEYVSWDESSRISLWKKLLQQLP